MQIARRSGGQENGGVMISAIHPQKAATTAVVVSRSRTCGSLFTPGVMPAATAPRASTKTKRTESPSIALLIQWRTLRANRVTFV